MEIGDINLTGVNLVTHDQSSAFNPPIHQPVSSKNIPPISSTTINFQEIPLPSAPKIVSPSFQSNIPDQTLMHSSIPGTSDSASLPTTNVQESLHEPCDQTQESSRSSIKQMNFLETTLHQSCHLKSPSAINQPVDKNILPSCLPTTTLQEKTLTLPSVINLIPIIVHNLIPKIKLTNSSRLWIRKSTSQKLPTPSAQKLSQLDSRALTSSTPKLPKLTVSKLPETSTSKLLHYHHPSLKRASCPPELQSCPTLIFPRSPALKSKPTLPPSCPINKPLMVSSENESACPFKNTFTTEIPKSNQMSSDDNLCCVPPSTLPQPNILNSSPEIQLLDGNLSTALHLDLTNVLPLAQPPLSNIPNLDPEIQILDDNVGCIQVSMPSQPNIQNSNLQVQILQENLHYMQPAILPKSNISNSNLEIESVSQSGCPIPGFEVKFGLFPPTKLNKICETLYTQELTFCIPKAMANQLFCPKGDLIGILRIVLQHGDGKQPEEMRNLGYTVSLEMNDITLGEVLYGFGSSLNIDVTGFLKGDECVNSGIIIVSFENLETVKDIHVYISIVRKLSVQEILTELKEKTPIPFDQTNNMIQLSLGMDILANTTKLRESYICQLSKRPIKVPCRGIYCDHYKCFDAEYFFEFYQNSNNLICPICSFSLEYEDLHVDGYFQDIFNSIVNGIGPKSVENDYSDNFSFSTNHELNVGIEITQDNSVINYQENIPKTYESCELEIPLRIPGFQLVTNLFPKFFIFPKIDYETTFSETFQFVVPIEHEYQLFSSTDRLLTAKFRVVETSYCISKENMPSVTIQLQINDITVPIPSKYKTEFTVDITKVLVAGTNSGIIKAIIQKPSIDFILSCTAVIVKKLSTQQMMEELKTKTYIPSSNSKKLVINSLKDGIKANIFTNQSRISVFLICPLGKTVMETPCKGIMCQHFTCFDALNFLKLYENSSNWMCPICDIVLEYDDLRVDGFLQEILKSMGVKPNDQFEVDIEGRCFILTDEDQEKITTVEDVEEENLSVSILPLKNFHKRNKSGSNSNHSLSLDDDANTNIKSLKIDQDCIERQQTERILVENVEIINTQTLSPTTLIYPTVSNEVEIVTCHSPSLQQNTFSPHITSSSCTTVSTIFENQFPLDENLKGDSDSDTSQSACAYSTKENFEIPPYLSDHNYVSIIDGIVDFKRYEKRGTEGNIEPDIHEIDTIEDDSNKLWCICRTPHNNRFMISCHHCEEWFHGECVDVAKTQGKNNMEKTNNTTTIWYCPPCKIILKTTEVETQENKQTLCSHGGNDVSRNNSSHDFGTPIITTKCRPVSLTPILSLAVSTSSQISKRQNVKVIPKLKQTKLPTKCHPRIQRSTSMVPRSSKSIEIVQTKQKELTAPVLLKQQEISQPVILPSTSGPKSTIPPAGGIHATDQPTVVVVRKSTNSMRGVDFKILKRPQGITKRPSIISPTSIPKKKPYIKKEVIKKR